MPKPDHRALAIFLTLSLKDTCMYQYLLNFFLFSEKKFFYFLKYIIHDWPTDIYLILNKTVKLFTQVKKNKQKRNNEGEWGFYGSHLEERNLELNFVAWTVQELKYQPLVYSRQLHRELNPGAEEVFSVFQRNLQNILVSFKYRKDLFSSFIIIIVLETL